MTLARPRMPRGKIKDEVGLGEEIHCSLVLLKHCSYILVDSHFCHFKFNPNEDGQVQYTVFVWELNCSDVVFLTNLF